MQLKRYSIFIGWLVSAAAIAVLLSFVSFDKLVEEIRSVSLFDALFLMALYLLGFIPRAFRARLLLPESSLSIAAAGVVVGYASNNVLPGRAGEFVRAFVVGWKSKVSRAQVLGTVLVERLFDLGAIVVLSLGAAQFVSLSSFAEKAIDLGFILSVVGGGVVIAASFASKQIEARFPPSKLLSLVVNLLRGVGRISRSPLRLLGVVLLSVLTWSLESVVFFEAAKLFSIELSVAQAVIVMGLVNLGVLVPSSPGGIGVFQAVAVSALAMFGASSEAGTAMAVVVHACQLIPPVLLGLALLPWLGFSSLRELRKKAAESEVEAKTTEKCE